MNFQDIGTQPLGASMFIDGQWLNSDMHRTIDVENPANEQIIAHIPEGTADDADHALNSAKNAQVAWSRRPAIERGRLVLKLARAVIANKAQYARLITMEQGKPLDQALGEVDAVENFLRYAAENARRIEGDIIPSDNPHEEIQIRRVPRGVVVGLTAWNYPAALVARKLGPAIVAGNTFVLLAHENTPLSGLFLASLAEQIGLPKGVFNVVTGRGPVIGQAMVEHPITNLVTMTGSTFAGKKIFAAGANELKVLHLELGGKAPFIVMEDADIDKAVDAAVTARYTNCGQICTCNERMYLHRAIADEFTEKFIAKSAALTIGDPMSNPDMGPKVSGLEVEKLDEMLQAGIDAGAEVLLKGGSLNEGEYEKGHWYAPSVLEVTDNQSPLIQNEVFGPIAPILRVDDFEQAIAMANDSEFGLSAYLFTKDISRMMRLPQDLKFGEIYFNRANGEQVQGFHSGWGHSGLGGEDGKYGFDGYLHKQTVYLSWE